MISKNKKRIALSLDKKMVDQIEEMSKRTGITKSEIMQNWLDQYVIFWDEDPLKKLEEYFKAKNDRK